MCRTLEINLALDNTHYDQVCVFVVKDPLDKSTKDRKLKVPGVIGCNVLQKMFKDGKGMDFLRDSSQRHPGLTDELMAFKSKQVWSERIEAKISTTGSGRIGAVKVLCKGNLVSIPARTLSLMMGSTPHLPDGSEVLIETADIASVIEGLMVCPTLTKVYNNTVKFQVLNLSSKCHTFHQSHKIVELYLGDVVLPDIEVAVTSKAGSDGVKLECQINQTAVQEVDDSWIKELDIDSSLSPKQRSDVIALLQQYGDVFSKYDGDLGCCTIGRHTISTEDDIPVKLPDRWIPPLLVPEVQKILKTWLHDGIIKQSNSPYASQLVLVTKKCGKLRACLDFRILNKKTIKDAFPLPSIDAALDTLKGSSYFSSLDLTQGYLQIPMDPKDQHKTAFRALGALYEFCRMPFGLCNAGSTFSRVLNNMMSDYLHDILILFLDDILVYAKTFESMVENLSKVFERLERAQAFKVSPFQEAYKISWA